MIPDLLWHQIVASVPIVCVDVCIVWDGAALLVLRAEAPARGRWWVPGGRLVKGEQTRSTAWRKAREEAGIDVKVGPVVHAEELCFPDGPGGSGVHSVTTCYLATPVGVPQPRIDGTSRAWAWCKDPDDFWQDMGEGEAERIVLHDYVRACLRGAGL